MSVRSAILHETCEELRTMATQLEDSRWKCGHDVQDANRADCQTFLLGTLIQLLKKADISVRNIVEWTDSLGQLHDRLIHIKLDSHEKGYCTRCLGYKLNYIISNRVDPKLDLESKSEAVHLAKQASMTGLDRLEFDIFWDALAL